MPCFYSASLLKTEKTFAKNHLIKIVFLHYTLYKQYIYKQRQSEIAIAKQHP